MEQPKTPIPETEQPEQQAIIAVLLKQVRLYEQENALLKKALGQTLQNLPREETPEWLAQLWMSLGKTWAGEKQEWMSYANNTLGHEQLWKSYPETGEGKTQEFISYAKTSVGHEQEWKSYPKTGVGQKQELEPHTKTGVGQQQELKPLPNFIEPAPPLIYRLADILRKDGFKFVEAPTLRRAAQLLIHFHNKGSGAYPPLRKLTGLSQGGLSKFMATLRGRALIMRTGYRQYALTNHAQELLQKALAG